MDTIVSREPEKIILNSMLKSGRPEFLAIYGRRRVGKTFLINEYFKKKKCAYFKITGQQKGAYKTQLKHFADSVQNLLELEFEIKPPDNWDDAFRDLTKHIKKIREPVILFFDELPWLVTSRSGLLPAMFYQWNTEWVYMNNVKLVVCGSATSWMLKNIVHGKGGKHSRLTQRINLQPFSLSESKQFLRHKRIKLDDYQLTTLYMALGGIPKYLELVNPGESATQAIDRICFEGLLLDEFDDLFDSLFKQPEYYEAVIRYLAEHPSGVSYNELAKAVKQSSGGVFTGRLYELAQTSFIQEFTPYGMKTKPYYRISDEYSFFYLTWIYGKKTAIQHVTRYWSKQSKTQAAISWKGNTFEIVCLKHITEIIKILDLGDYVTWVGGWRYVPSASNNTSNNEKGAQIDLLIERSDNAITLCEIKFYSDQFSISKDYAKKLKDKIQVFRERTKTKKQIFLCLITSHGMKPNKYSNDLVDAHVMLSQIINN